MDQQQCEHANTVSFHPLALQHPVKVCEDCGLRVEGSHEQCATPETKAAISIVRRTADSTRMLIRADAGEVLVLRSDSLGGYHLSLVIQEGVPVPIPQELVRQIAQLRAHHVRQCEGQRRA